MKTRCQIVIPARLASTRLPEKLLRRAAGKTILQHTFESASKSSVSADVVIAVDDMKLAEQVDAFGGRWVMTSRHCASGTDRIAEVAAAMPEIDIFVNVQGDEPEIEPAVIDSVASTLMGDPDADMATAGTPIRQPSTLQDPSCVKIVMAWDGGAGQGRAIYFSRAAVPFARDRRDEAMFDAEPPVFWHHIGLYAYRREFLQWFSAQGESPLERTERLEQLRAVEAGKKILVTRVESATPGIDTSEDLDAFVERLKFRDATPQQGEPEK